MAENNNKKPLGNHDREEVIDTIVTYMHNLNDENLDKIWDLAINLSCEQYGILQFPLIITINA